MTVGREIPTHVSSEPETSAQSALTNTFMHCFLRNCVECPKCLTRYLVAFSPYGNGSYLVPAFAGLSDEYILYCSCGRPPVSSRWRRSELKRYAVSKVAHDRGYGTPAEIVPVGHKLRNASFEVTRMIDANSMDDGRNSK